VLLKGLGGGLSVLLILIVAFKNYMFIHESVTTFRRTVDFLISESGYISLYDDRGLLLLK
jgi:hypothetical protein